ncbi:MAG: M1 family metallopeptidase [Candidatus Hodarchaeota archaeon]
MNHTEWNILKHPSLSNNAEQFSRYNLSVIFHEATSSVTGVLSVDYYNNDPIPFTQIPFHLFLSGMQYENRIGDIDIVSVTTITEPKTSLTFQVNDAAQLLWVNLESTLEPNQRTFFEIEFYSVLPNGPLDRANSHGSNFSESRIYKFTSFYPMPCVYDSFDGWNTDPYLGSCDPFYHDMAYYNFTIEAPNGVIITATGELIEKEDKGPTTVYHFDPKHPVREVTFAASRYYQIQSTIIDGVNISTYYIPKSGYLWENDALNYAVNAFDLFNDTFGFYPYSTLNIVEEYAPYLGMEYPLQVYVSEAIDHYTYTIPEKKKILEKAIVHEIAHQWWYNLVGFDQIDWGFLDEGLTCWSTDYYGRIYYSNWEYFQYTRYFERVRTYYVDYHLPSKLNQSAYDIIQNNYDWVYLSYYKSPLIFEKISRTLGQDNFIQGLKTFFELYHFKIALLPDLQRVFENLFNPSLDWLFYPWFDNPFLPKYNFHKYRYNEVTRTLKLTINDLNEYLNVYPYSQQLELQIYDHNGILLYNEWVWINGTTVLNIPLSLRPGKLRLEYWNEVIVQLSSSDVTYLEKILDEPRLISGYEICSILIFFMLPLIFLISKILLKLKKISKI